MIFIRDEPKRRSNQLFASNFRFLLLVINGCMPNFIEIRDDKTIFGLNVFVFSQYFMLDLYNPSYAYGILEKFHIIDIIIGNVLIFVVLNSKISFNCI